MSYDDNPRCPKCEHRLSWCICRSAQRDDAGQDKRCANYAEHGWYVNPDPCPYCALAARDEENERLKGENIRNYAEFLQDVSVAIRQGIQEATDRAEQAEAERDLLKRRVAELGRERDELLAALKKSKESYAECLGKTDEDAPPCIGHLAYEEADAALAEAREKLRRVADFLERAGHPPDAHFVKMASDVVKFRE